MEQVGSRAGEGPSAPYRAAVIGCGRIGSEFADDPRAPGIYSHAGAYAACARTSLVAICDVDAGQLDRCGRRWGVSSLYVDPAEMLGRERPDVVSVCTPDETHAGLAMAALEAPGLRAVLVEKPLAMSVAVARALVQRAEERGVCLAVNYSRRFAPSHARLQRFIEAGGVGSVQKVTGYYTKGIFHNGTHWLDLARYLVGEVADVEAWETAAGGGADPTLDVRLRFASGASGVLQGCSADCFSVFEMDIVGTVGRVRILDGGHVFETFAVGESPRYTGYVSLTRTDALQGGLEDVLLRAVEDVARCLDGGGAPLCSGRDGLAALAIASAAKESVLGRRPVAVERP